MSGASIGFVGTLLGVALGVVFSDNIDTVKGWLESLTGSQFWQPHHLGDEDFVPGAIYLDLSDVDGDGVKDIVTVGEPELDLELQPS